MLSLLLFFSVPNPALLKEVVAQKYILNVNDCSNKAAEYFSGISEDHPDARIVVIAPRRAIFTRHAVVYVNKLYIDCTNGKKTSKLWLWGKEIYRMNRNELHIGRLINPTEWK